MIYNQQTGEFTVRKGPIFANLVLADEINRAPAKVQWRCSRRCRSARSPSATQTYPLPEPFLVLATQNPIEQEGTYPLPEAQVDRFMLKVKVGYPTREEERRDPRPHDRRGDAAEADAGGRRPSRSPRRARSSTRSTWTTR